MDGSEKICRKTIAQDVFDRWGIKTLIKILLIFAMGWALYGRPQPEH